MAAAWVVQASNGTMSSANMIGTHRRAAPLQAGVLLVALVAHLFFMASPFHAQMIGEGLHVTDMDSRSADAAIVMIDAMAAQETHGSHCVIRWTTATQELLLAGVVAVALATTLGVLELNLPGPRPIARVLGPPSTGDPQALLQVFRL